MILFLRTLPFLVGALQAFAFLYQSKFVYTYPWLVLLGILFVPISATLITWKKIPYRDLLQKMLPTYVTLACLAFGLLLVEGAWQFWLLAGCAIAVSCISLELLFLLQYDPAAYPVHGISRVNVGYVPIAVWYAASTSIGMITFLHTDPRWHLALMSVLGALLFRSTGHEDATSTQTTQWTLFGALIGVEVGIIGIFLPIPMQTQGLLAAILLSAVLRSRRYLYAPQPSKMVAYIESSAAVIVFIVMLTTTTWI